MTITATSFPARGESNPMTRPTTGIESLLLDLQAQINSLTIGSVTGKNLFYADTLTSAVNVTMTAQPNILKMSMTTSGKYVKLGSCTAEDTLYDGGVYWVWNAGSYAFDVQDNAGTVIVTALAPGEIVGLMCISDATAAGEWQVFGRQENIYSSETQSSSVDVTRTSQPNVLKMSMTAADKYLKLGSCTAQPSLYDGGVYWVWNAGSYAFDVQDNAGTVIVTALAPGEIVGLMCISDATAAGEWKIFGRHTSTRNVEKTVSFTLDANANNVTYKLNHASTAINVTVPPNSSVPLDIGSQIVFLRYGAAECSFLAGSGVTIQKASWAGLDILDQYTMAGLIKIGTDEWSLVGNV